MLELAYAHREAGPGMGNMVSIVPGNLPGPLSEQQLEP